MDNIRKMLQEVRKSDSAEILDRLKGYLQQRFPGGDIQHLIQDMEKEEENKGLLQMGIQ